jgi:hypothetical protein
LLHQIRVEETVKRRLNLGNACHHSVQDLSLSYLLSKNIKIKTYKNIIFLQFCILYTVYCILNMSENKVLRRIFGTKRDEVIGGLRNLQGVKEDGMGM